MGTSTASKTLSAAEITEIAVAAATQAVTALLADTTPAPAKSTRSSAKKSTVKRPTAKQKARAAESAKFVEYLRTSKPERDARKARNAAISATLREAGLPIGGPVWTEAQKLATKAGVLSAAKVKSLSALV